MWNRIICLTACLAWGQDMALAEAPKGASTAAPASVYDELAKDICRCAKDITEIDSEIQRLYKKQDRAGLERLKARIPNAYKEFNSCMERVGKKYANKKIDDDPNAAYEALKKHCPQVVDLLEVRGLD